MGGSWRCLQAPTIFTSSEKHLGDLGDRQPLRSGKPWTAGQVTPQQLWEVGVQGGVLPGLTWHKLEEESTQDHPHSDTSLWPNTTLGSRHSLERLSSRKPLHLGLPFLPGEWGQVQVSAQAASVNTDTKLCGPLSGSGEQDLLAPTCAHTYGALPTTGTVSLGSRVYKGPAQRRPID